MQRVKDKDLDFQIMVKFCGSNIGGLYINLDAVPIVIVCSKKFFPVCIQARGSSKCWP